MMRRIFGALILMGCSSLAVADPNSSLFAYPSTGMQGVYQKYAVPTPVPTPYAGDVTAAHIQLFQPNFSVDFKGGAAVPLGNSATYNRTGYSLGLDLVYGASSIVDVAFSTTYVSMPYSLTTAAQPQTSLGFGVKALIHAYHQKKMDLEVEGGMGYYLQNSASSVQVGTNSYGQPVQGTAYASSGGVGFNLGALLRYQFVPSLSAFAEVDFVQVSVDGGTGATAQYMTPDLGISYTF